MRVIACSFPFSKAYFVCQAKGQHIGARLASQLPDVLDPFELTDGCLLGGRINNTYSNHSMTRELQSTLESTEIVWPALRNHIKCTAHVIQLALDAFRSSHSGIPHTKSWEAHERDQQY